MPERCYTDSTKAKEGFTEMGDKAVRTKEKILQTSEELFLLKGYENVSIDEICASIHLTKGAFYYHFKTKEDILALLFLPRLDRYLEKHYHENEAASSGERILQLAQCTFECGKLVGRSVLAQSATSMLNGQQELLHQEDRIHTHILTGIWEQAQREGTIPKDLDIRHFRLIYSSVITGILLNWAAEKPESDEYTDWDGILRLAIGRVFPN